MELRRLCITCLLSLLSFSDVEEALSLCLDSICGADDTEAVVEPNATFFLAIGVFLLMSLVCALLEDEGDDLVNEGLVPPLPRRWDLGRLRVEIYIASFLDLFGVLATLPLSEVLCEEGK